MRERKLTRIPRSKAKTAYGLCMDVIRAIQAEPRRADMRVAVQIRDVSDPDAPACGTVGCFAGWIMVLRQGREQTLNGNLCTYYVFNAENLLGHNICYLTAGRNNLYVFNSGEGDACETTTPGTPAHARAVVARIRKFVRINKTALQARKLSKVRS